MGSAVQFCTGSCIHHLRSLRCGAVEHEDIVRLLVPLHCVLKNVIDAVQILNVLGVHLREVLVVFPLPLHNQPALTQLLLYNQSAVYGTFLPAPPHCRMMIFRRCQAQKNWPTNPYTSLMAALTPLSWSVIILTSPPSMEVCVLRINHQNSF